MLPPAQNSWRDPKLFDTLSSSQKDCPPKAARKLTSATTYTTTDTKTVTSSSNSQHDIESRLPLSINIAVKNSSINDKWLSPTLVPSNFFKNVIRYAC